MKRDVKGRFIKDEDDNGKGLLLNNLHECFFI